MESSRQEHFEIKDVVKNKKKQIKKVFELQYGFIDKLVSQGALDFDQVKAIQATCNHQQLLDELVEKLLSTVDERKQFVEVLKRNDQRHLAVFIEQDGRRFSRSQSSQAEFKCWPLDNVRKSRIVQHLGDLVKLLEPNYELVREWASSGCINHQQCCDIEQTSPRFKRNRKLLNFLLKRSVADYDMFVASLKKCDQSHLAKLLEISDEEDNKTENAPQKWKVDLKQSLEFNYGLLDDLVSGGVIKYEDPINTLEVKSSFLVQRDRILDLVIEKSSADHQWFLEALKTTGQEHLANYIEQNGCPPGEQFKCWPLDSQLESKITRNLCQLIELILPDVDFVAELYSSWFINTLQNCDLDETRNEFDKTRKLLNFLFQSSIANCEIFVQCLRKSSQCHLAPLLENDVVIETFDFTTSRGSIQETEIVGEWKEVLKTQNRVKCDEIRSVVRKEVHADVDLVDMKTGHSYLLCKTPTSLTTLYQKFENGSLADTVQSIFNSLMLGSKYAVQVIKTKGRLSASELQRRVEIFSRDIVEFNELNKRKNKSGFSSVSFESKDTLMWPIQPTISDDPQLLVSLNEPPTNDDDLPRAVKGLTMLETYLYVVYECYSVIEMFHYDYKDRFKKFEDIYVEGMYDPNDMVGYGDALQLFISDMDVIWRVDLKTGVSDVFVKLGNQNQYAYLSLVDNRLLVTSSDCLLIYHIRFSPGRKISSKIENIPYTEAMKKCGVLRAIESNRGTFFVCHRQPSNNNVVITEINSDGRVLGGFNNDNEEHIYSLYCEHFALDYAGRLLVADTTYGKVVLLDEHLTYDRTMLDKEQLNNEWPYRLTYNKNNKKLAIGLNNGQVKMFTC